MSWYKIDVRHGPGHQSRTVEYKYIEDEWYTSEKAIEEDLKEMVIEDWWECPIGYITKLIELPEDVRQSKIRWYKDKIDVANKMLRMLYDYVPHKYYAICNDGETLQGVTRDDLKDNEDPFNLIEITKAQFDIYIKAENSHIPTLSQLTKVRCADCENILHSLGVDERMKRKCYTKCFVRPE